MLLFIGSYEEDEAHEANSNTSHVIVYRPFDGCFAVGGYIQIHLMLLFIGIGSF